MYEKMGAQVDQTEKRVRFRLLVPHCGKGEGEGDFSDSGIKCVAVVGSFQKTEGGEWDAEHPLEMDAEAWQDPEGPTKGTLFSAQTGPLPDGFYEYQYLVTFDGGEQRRVTDPCSRYAGRNAANSGFVVGGADAEIAPLTQRRPLSDLVIYELHLRDFTEKLPDDDRSPAEKAIDRLDELQRLGVNAVEFMPLTAWADDCGPEGGNYSWGYNPVSDFAIAGQYVEDPNRETNRLVNLKRLVSACHERGMHVFFDAVFNHADAPEGGQGFAYHWLWQNPEDSPFTGDFAEHNFFEDLNYANRCTLEYVRDAALMWVDEFGVDGIRFDNTMGLWDPAQPDKGLPVLLKELRTALDRRGLQEFPLVLEHEWNYNSIDVVNQTDATSCWFDPFRQWTVESVAHGINPCLMRALDAGQGFNEGKVPVIYLENHDHLRFTSAAGGRDAWVRTQPYVIALGTCAGGVMLFQGQEYGSDYGVGETEENRVVPRPLDWDWLQSDPGPQTFELYRKVLAIRAAHPALRGANFQPLNWHEGDLKLNAEGLGIDKDTGMVIYHRWGEDAEGRMEDFYVVLNTSDATQKTSFAVPNDGLWKDLMSDAEVTPNDGRVEVEIGSNWGAIYWHRA